MEFEAFINQLENLTDQIKTLVDSEMERKGDTDEECQFVCVFNKVSDLEYAIAGITLKDIKIA